MKATRPIFFLLLLLFCLPSQASSLEKYKSNCAEIGFTVGTKKFGDCVLELRRADISKGKKSENTATQTSGGEISAEMEFALNKIIQTRKIEFQQELEARREAQLREQQRRAGAAMIQFGLGLAQSGKLPVFDPSTNNFRQPKQVDQHCVSQCVGLGFLHGLCESKCSF